MADQTITEIARRVESLGQGPSGAAYLAFLSLSQPSIWSYPFPELTGIESLPSFTRVPLAWTLVLLAAPGTHGPHSDGPYPAIVSYMGWDDHGYCNLRYGNNYVIYNPGGTCNFHISMPGRNVVTAWSWVNTLPRPRAPPGEKSKNTDTRTASHNKRPPSRARKQAEPQQAV
jgi:hypothetical protein